MKYQENCSSKTKSGVAFLLCLAIVIAIVLLSRALPIEKYRIVIQLATFLVVGALVFLLYRFVLTVHTYILKDQNFTVYRGEQARQKTIASLTDNMILLIAPASYSGARLPKGDFIAVNACSSFNGKRKGYCIWCTPNANDCYRLYIEPSTALVEKLQQVFPDRFI